MIGHGIEHVAAAVRAGRRTAVNVVEEAICRHLDSDLGAYVIFDTRGARAQARSIDRAVGRGEDPGPLAGVPVSVKDLYGVKGLTTRAGTHRELPAKWQREGFLVRAVRALGGVIVGKTHTVEFAFGGVGMNTHTGTPVNPWDADHHRIPGGSSAGAGVSLWEGSAMIALGTDTGGSIRIPASATGVVGYRHTTGRWPATGVVPLSTTLDTVGVLTHTVADLLHVFCAVDAIAPRAAKEGPSRSGTNREGVRRLRIGVPGGSSPWREAGDDIAAVAQGALEELERAGAVLVEVDAPELDRAGEAYLSGDLIQPELLEFLERELLEWTSVLDPLVGTRLRSAADVPATRYLKALRLRHRLARALRARLAQHEIDILATPTLSITPPAVDTLQALDAYGAANRTLLSVTSPASMVDMCAVTLPVGLDRAGMPVGLHWMGPGHHDHQVLGRAAAAESVLGINRSRLGLPTRIRSGPKPRALG